MKIPVIFHDNDQVVYLVQLEFIINDEYFQVRKYFLIIFSSDKGKQLILKKDSK